MGLLRSVEPNFRSTTFKRHYNSTKEFISKAESHLRDDPEDNLDPAYTEDLFTFYFIKYLLVDAHMWDNERVI